MTAPRYYRRAPTFVRAILSVLVVVIVAVMGVRAGLASLRQAERERIEVAAALTASKFDAERTQLVHRIDSLSRLTSRADTVLRTRLRTLHDTLWLPADTSPTVRYAACRAQLDTLATDCDAFRARAGEQLSATKEAWDTEKAAARATSLQLATARRSAERRAAQQTWERRICAASVVGNVLQWRMK